MSLSCRYTHPEWGNFRDSENMTPRLKKGVNQGGPGPRVGRVWGDFGRRGKKSEFVHGFHAFIILKVHSLWGLSSRDSYNAAFFDNDKW